MTVRITLIVFGFLLVLFACDGFVKGMNKEEVADQNSSSDPNFSMVTSNAGTGGGLIKTGNFFKGSVIASDPSIVKAGNGYRMFFTDLDARKSRTVIAYADSPDGVTWSSQTETQPVKNLVIQGKSGSWAENVESAAIVKVGSSWKLFFSGYKDKGKPFKGFPASLGVVTSTDGVNFSDLPAAPILEPTKGWYDNDAIYSPTIWYEGGTYYMIYVGHAYTNTSQITEGGVFLLSAQSPDGINWTKSKQPIARPGQFKDWRQEGIAEPYVVKSPSGEYILLFTGLSGEKRAIGIARATAPLGPYKFSAEPILGIGIQGTPDEHQVLAPAVLIQNGELRMWYLAANSNERLAIGHARGQLNKVMGVIK